MHAVVAVASFVGAWLLVVGPIYQAALELRAQDIAEERIREVGRSLTPPPPITRWWWLVPPVMLYLLRRRIVEYRLQYFQALSLEDAKAMLVYFSKATAWMMVASGGILTAFSATWSLTECFHLGPIVFAALVVVLLGASIAYPSASVHRSDRILERKAGDPRV
jgi:hypothetical protein